MLVADSCGNANAWCRDDPYHLDLALSVSGSTATVRNMSYNGTLAPGAATTFGFTASAPGVPVLPPVTCTPT